MAEPQEMRRRKEMRWGKRKLSWASLAILQIFPFSLTKIGSHQMISSRGLAGSDPGFIRTALVAELRTRCGQQGNGVVALALVC